MSVCPHHATSDLQYRTVYLSPPKPEPRPPFQERPRRTTTAYCCRFRLSRLRKQYMVLILYSLSFIPSFRRSFPSLFRPIFLLPRSPVDRLLLACPLPDGVSCSYLPTIPTVPSPMYLRTVPILGTSPPRTSHAPYVHTSSFHFPFLLQAVPYIPVPTVPPTVPTYLR